MYFDRVPLFDFYKSFENSFVFYAHRKKIAEDEEKELLVDHLSLTIDYLNRLIKEKNLEFVLENFEKQLVSSLSAPSRLFWRELLLNAIYAHDFGKTNPNFQYQKMENKIRSSNATNNSHHSFFSALIYSNHYLNKMMDFPEEDHPLLFLSIFLNSYTISKHHGSLLVFNDFLKDISHVLTKEKDAHCCFYNEIFYFKDFDSNIIAEYFNDNVKQLIEADLWQSIPWTIYSRFVYGLLVSCDFYSTSDFMHYPPGDFGCITDVSHYLNAFKRTEVYKNIQKFDNFQNSQEENPFKNNPINGLRSQLFLETQEALQEKKNESLYFIEAPTGSGKTNLSMNLALNLLEGHKALNKIIYVFPFNTLVEQTKESLSKAFNGEKDVISGITVVNGITAIKKIKSTEEGEWNFEFSEKIDYEASLLSRQFLHYPIVLTTHINFFNILFGTDREAVFPLAHLANSVIVLDEIQCYPNALWKEIILFFQSYAKLLNFKILIMSATLPNLGQLSFDHKVIPKLIKNPEKYYQHPLFKDRVLLDFSLLKIKKENLLDQLLEKVIETSISLNKEKKYESMENKILIEFIYKSTAIKFFSLLGEELRKRSVQRSLYCMTGDDNKGERKKIINAVNSGKNLILVATQVVEAGIDIDMDMGFKDTSILDSEEQFLGRINRSCLKKGSIVFFFNYDSSDKLYKDDFRKEFNLSDPNVQTLLKEKNFQSYYAAILEKVNQSKDAFNDNNIQGFSRNILWQFNFSELKEKMKLIKDNVKKYSIFISQTLSDINENTIDGELLWESYKTLLWDTSIPYSKKRVQLSELYEKMDYFIYEISDDVEFHFIYQDRISELFFCLRQEVFFPNGKFNSAAFKAYFKNNLFC